jgi:hypothetical protein
VIRRTIGVLSVLMTGDEPSRCPESEIAALKWRVDERGVVRLPLTPSQNRRRIVAGTKVNIIGSDLNRLSSLPADGEPGWATEAGR